MTFHKSPGLEQHVEDPAYLYRTLVKSWALHEKHRTMCALVLERAEYRQRVDRERHAKHKRVK